MDSFRQRLAAPVTDMEEQKAQQRATAPPHIVSAADMLAAADADDGPQVGPRANGTEDWITKVQCQTNPLFGQGWHYKNHYSACVSTPAFVVYLQCSGGSCTEKGRSDFLLTMIAKGSKNPREVIWEVWLENWRHSRNVDLSQPMNLYIPCIANADDGGDCKSNAPSGVTRKVADWSASQYMTMTTTNTTPTPKANGPHPADDKVSDFLYWPTITMVNYNRTWRTPTSVWARCDNAGYIAGASTSGGCSFPATAGILQYDYNEPGTAESVAFFHQAMKYLDTLKKPMSIGTYVPGGYFKQPVTGQYQPLTRSYYGTREYDNRKLVVAECRRLYTVKYDKRNDGQKNQCDEFPFNATYENAYYSTKAGGAQTFAVKPVLGDHNGATGRALGSFYQRDRILEKDPFYVDIINAPGSCPNCANQLPPPVVPTNYNSAGKLGGSFIQPDLIDGWSDAQLAEELSTMKSLGMDRVVLQWSANSHDNRAGGARTAVCPSGLSGFSMNTATDVVGRLLSKADAAGVEVWVGLQVNDQWWKVYADQQWWLDYEASVARSLAQDLWSRYGGHSSFKGWYLSFEMDNVHFGSWDAQNRMIDFYNNVSLHVKSISGKRPVAIAPFFNAVNTYLPGWQDAVAYGATWRHILEFAEIDVIALQDGVGAGHATPSTLAPWFSALKQAIADSGSPAILIADTETYMIGAAELQPMASRDVVAAINAVRPYVSGYWAFSFNHYQSPRSRFGIDAYYNAYKLWTQAGGDGGDGSSPSNPGTPTATVNDPQTVTLRWATSSDQGSGVAGYHIYRDYEVVADVFGNVGEFVDRQLEGGRTYRYYVQAFDGSGLTSWNSGEVAATTPALPASPTNYARCGAADGQPGCGYTSTITADAAYPDSGGELTDGKLGPELYGPEWQGRNAPGTYSFTVDLGTTRNVTEINSRWFQVRQDYSFLPPQREVRRIDRRRQLHHRGRHRPAGGEQVHPGEDLPGDLPEPAGPVRQSHRRRWHRVVHARRGGGTRAVTV